MKLAIFTSIHLALQDYYARVKLFTPNARLFLLNIVMTGAALGVYRLIFNFYVLSLGYDEAILGTLITTNNLTALLAALPVGYLADILGRKRSLVTSVFLTGLSILVMVIYPGEAIFYAMNVLSGVAQSLGAVTNAPFLMENSGEIERTYLFSFDSGLQMLMASVGTWLGGYLPTWIAGIQGGLPTSSQAYGGALLVIALLMEVGLLPLLLLHTRNIERSERSVFAPLGYAAEHPALLNKLILPMLVTSIGAGLIMPFMNVFFRQVHHQSDPVIGTLFAWGSLAMGIGLLLAPPLADRMGNIQFVVITQALSIPFLVLLGFSPLFWMSAAAYYVRLALMNMSTPVYQTFVMEHVEDKARATVASLVSMSWNFGWAFSPSLSGWLQVHYGFGPPFIGTLILYTISIYLYWVYFWRRGDQTLPNRVIGD
jgi:MFS family permease